MAKTASKSAARAPKKSSAKPKTISSSEGQIEKASVEALKKLQALGIEQELQNDIEWCLGSYRADHNPVGLYAMAERALSVLKAEQAKKTKGVTAKLVSDLEKAVQSR
ncbi:hypothetical protein KK083_13035 [Fulvivirgaceae bacterium PWU4]|uniref:Uncharacterized protein n=1 Tax=Chryseosolibacter histidini TaxID=2782349 RepID=A0AAP2GPC6_9BACT|nr:hypothetical protein [Chryseosolibacter histidini]MBT1697810.1 hypothetical protein [Chryseosolibacter histidini]